MRRPTPFNMALIALLYLLVALILIGIGYALLT